MIRQKLDAVAARFGELERLLSDPAVIARTEEYRALSREHARLAPVVSRAREYERALADRTSAEELLDAADPELRAFAAAEKTDLDARIPALERELTILLLPPDPHDGKDIIVEIRAGTGGEEAALFAGDLFRMYSRYAEAKGWRTEVMDANATGLGGYKEVILSVAGPDVWKHFKYERGIHRVQRVPETEASGRIHTSAVTVAVLPEAEEVDVDVRPEDLRIDTYRASGAGGQHVNKTESAIRITHLPSGIVVACQDERSQMKNRAKAMRMLRAKLLEHRLAAQEAATASDRRSQVGSGDRSEKVRTYNFPQNRITDHRIDFSWHRLKDALEGDLDELISRLRADEQTRLLAAGDA